MSIEALRKAVVTKKGVKRLGLPKGTVVYFDDYGLTPHNKIYNLNGNVICENVEVAKKEVKFFDCSLREI